MGILEPVQWLLSYGGEVAFARDLGLSHLSEAQVTPCLNFLVLQMRRNRCGKQRG